MSTDDADATQKLRLRSPGQPLTDDRLRELGLPLRPLAHEVAALCRQFLERHGDVDTVLWTMGQVDDQTGYLRETMITVPAHTLAVMAAILSTLPKPRGGRPLLPSTTNALQLVKKVGSTRKVAKLLAESTGEPLERVRARLRGHKRRAQARAKKRKKLR